MRLYVGDISWIDIGTLAHLLLQCQLGQAVGKGDPLLSETCSTMKLFKKQSVQHPDRLIMLTGIGWVETMTMTSLTSLQVMRMKQTALLINPTEYTKSECLHQCKMEAI